MNSTERHYRARADIARALLKAPWGGARKYYAATLGADLCLPPAQKLRRFTCPGFSGGLVSRALAVAERRALAQALLAGVPRERLAGAGVEGGLLAGPSVGLSDALRATDPHARAVYAVASMVRDARNIPAR